MTRTAKRDHAFYKPIDIINMARKELAGEKTCLPDSYQHVNVRRIIRIIRQARSNPGVIKIPERWPLVSPRLTFLSVFIPFDSMSLFGKTKRSQRETLLKTVYLGEIEEPTVVVSKDRVPLIYYMPGIYSEVVEHEILAGAVALQNVLEDIGWRADPKLLVDRESNEYPAGSSTFAYSWYGQGAKRTLPPERSANLDKNKEDVESWIRTTQHIQLAVDITLALIHPQAYYQASKTRRIIEKSGTPKSREWAKKWGSVYTGISVISNRWCESHYDTMGYIHHYDALVNAGDAKVKLDMPDIHASFPYLPGTGMFFPASGFKHGVDGWDEGERSALAFFMRQDVIGKYNNKALDLPSPIPLPTTNADRTLP